MCDFVNIGNELYIVHLTKEKSNKDDIRSSENNDFHYFSLDYNQIFHRLRSGILIIIYEGRD
jgi:hypothetical protein